MKHLNNQYKLVFLLVIAFSLILVGCTKNNQDNSYTEMEIKDTAPQENIPSDSAETSNTNTQPENIPSTQNSQTTTSNSQIVQSDKKLPDVTLSNLKIYDLGQKKDVSLNEPILASNPVEMSITLKNIGTAPYVNSKGFAPVLIFMITEGYTGNLYFYSTNTTPLNPGDERVYKTNVIKFRDIGTHKTRIYPNIQYLSVQPEELSIENNEMNIELTVKAK